MRARLTFLTAMVAVLAAGCGPPENEGVPEISDFAPTRACLASAEDVEVSTTDLDFVASTALGGAMRVDLPANFLVLAFGETLAEGERIERAYRRFAGESIPIDDVLRRQGNVVMVWNAPPSPEEETLVLGCFTAAS